MILSPRHWRVPYFPLLTVLVLSGSAFLSGCATEPITGRSQIFLLSEKQLNEMGALSYKQMVGKANISSDAQANALVERVGRRIAAAADRRLEEEGREPYEWEFKVVDDPKMINAFALPGGKVAFYSGILPICASEAGVAVVMGHEVAHAYMQHGRDRVSRNVLVQVGFETAMAALGGEQASETAQLTLAALGVGYQVGVELPFSRGDESAADRGGLLLMAEAGYDPNEATSFWQRMENAGGAGGPEFLRTHPTHGTRIDQIREWLPEAMEVYQRARSGGGE